MRPWHAPAALFALAALFAPGLASSALISPALASPALASSALASPTTPAPEIAGATLAPATFSGLDGWRDDDQAAAFATFLKSCAARRSPPAEVGPASRQTLGPALAGACAAAERVVKALGGAAPSPRVARLFFEAVFRPYHVIPQDRAGGFFTGYYEPEMDGALTPGDGFTVPVHARPPDLVMLGRGPTPNSGGAIRRLPDGREVPYYDRGEIEDGALAGRGLEIAYLRDPVDLFFMQIQGSGRVRLPDGRVLRLNYDGYNGHTYLAVARLLIARGLVPRDEMSMDRIRAFMAQDPQAGRALRRENRSYAFFKALDLPADAGAMGAEGVPLTAGRSLAVDRLLHAYGTPVFVAANLPLSAPGTAEPFRRLMIAQDTGSAIVGPARADLYFGAGPEMASLAGRLRHDGQFTILVPRRSGTAAR